MDTVRWWTYSFFAVLQLAHQVRYVQRHAYYYVTAESNVREQGPSPIPSNVVEQRPLSGRLLEEIKQSGGFCVRPSLIEQTTQTQNLYEKKKQNIV
jgi:hypothetical protein